MTAVLFDNDGLLLDTEAVWTRAESEVHRRRGGELTLAHKLELVGKPTAELSELIARHLGLAEPDPAIAGEVDELVFAELERGIEPMAGAVALVDELIAVGVPVGLVSNSPRSFVARTLELAAISDRFAVIVSGHEVAAPKPAPDAYLAACAQLDVQPSREVIVLEDSPTGVAAGLAAGLYVVGVPSVPGVTLETADLVGASLSDPVVRARLGLG